MESPPHPKEATPSNLTRLLAIDCEMVGVGVFGQSELARVSIVNELGTCVYDTFAKPSEPVTHYRTVWSGVRPTDLENAPLLDTVRAKVQSIVKGRILVGHAIRNDLKVLRLDNHPEIRDTSMFYREKLQRLSPPSLKLLAKQYLNLDIQTGEHSSIEDAKVTLELYMLHRKEWEETLLIRKESALLPSISNSNIPNPTPISELSINPTVDDIEANSDSIFLRQNIVPGAYRSTGHYADVQFRLLREDLLRPIRDRVKFIRRNKQLCQGRQIKWIYRGVKLMGNSKKDQDTSEIDSESELGFEVKGSGVLKIPIDANNLRDIDWDDSKLFMSGSLLLVSPDSFSTVKLAVVGRRPRQMEMKEEFYHLLIPVYFIIDGVSLTLNEWHKVLVVESPAYFEAYRHTLQQFHNLDFENFALKKYIVDAETRPHIPGYLKNLAASGQLSLDFSVFMKGERKVTIGNLESINFASQAQFPSHEELGWDESQHLAFFTSLFQELSIVQGPPGTGKTFLGLQLMKFFLTQEPSLTGNAPLLIIAYTNHALDQSLELVYNFLLDKEGSRKAAQSILRFGGGCKSETILPLTKKAKEEEYALQKKLIKDYQRKLEEMKKIEAFLQQLKEAGVSESIESIPGFLNFSALPKNLIILLLEKFPYAEEVWSHWTQHFEELLKDPFKTLGFKKFDCLVGGRPNEMFLIKEKSGGKIKFPKLLSLTFDIDEFRDILRDASKDMTTFLVYVHFFLLRRLLDFAVSFPKIQKRVEVALATIQSQMTKPLKDVRVIGMTTTGAVKFKKFVHQLKPKITFVEEAAHVLESHVVACLTEDMEQLILIGDHQQLRPLTADHDLTNEYSLDVSLMERLVRNGIQQGRKNWDQLNMQHRMRPDIADLIRPVIYKELNDHPCVSTWPSVRGVEKNLFFLDHKEINSKEKFSTSYVNHFEATFVFDLVKYLVESQQYPATSITVIASYAAQKFLIQKEFQQYSERYGKELNKVLVSTIDGYQGEQNDIIIFSLVRSNKEMRIGFLKTDNRVCVALSRARQGFYMIGNMSCLIHESDTWRHISGVLISKECIGARLPLTRGKFLPNKLQNLPGNLSSPVLQNQTPPQKPKQKATGNHKTPALQKPTLPFTPKQKVTPAKPAQATVTKFLPCGKHSVMVPFNADVSNIKCITTVLKKLSCGHERNDHCHIPVDKVQCNQQISILKLPCHHVQTYEKPVPCKEVNMTCEKCAVKKTQKKKPSKAVPNTTIKLPCGHTIPYNGVESVPKCSIFVARKLPCDHRIKAPCHIPLNNLKCDKRILKMTFNKCGHEVIFPSPGARCNKVKECKVQVANVLKCGHIVQQACHEIHAKKAPLKKCKERVLSKAFLCGFQINYGPPGAICGNLKENAHSCSDCVRLTSQMNEMFKKFKTLGIAK